MYATHSRSTFAVELRLQVLHASASQLAYQARKEKDMKHCNTPACQTMGCLGSIACAVAPAVACTVSLSHPVSTADHVRLPSVPMNLQVPVGNTAFLEGDADGT